MNAITSMSRLLLRLPEALPELTHPLIGGPTVNAAMIEGGSAPNVVPDRCVVEIDRRTLPGETDPAAVLAPFERLAESIREEHPEVHIAFQVRDWCDAAEGPPDDPIIRLAGDAVAAETDGGRPAAVGFGGITDARYYLNEAKIPAVILGPGSLTVAHTANEWVRVEELVTAARAYARLFVGYVGT